MHTTWRQGEGRLKAAGPSWGDHPTGRFKRGGLPDLDSSFLFCPFWDFPDFSGIFPIRSGDGSGIFPIRSFSLSRPFKSTYEEQSRKGPRHNLDLSQKSGKHPGFETPRFSFSQNCVEASTPPKGPRRTKNTTGSKFTACSEFTIAL